MINNILLMAPPADQGFLGYVPLIAIMVIFYIFMLRPQQQKAKKAREYRSSLAKGMNVVTIGGIHGKIESVSDTTVTISTKGGGKLEVERSAISSENASDEMVVSNRG